MKKYTLEDVEMSRSKELTDYLKVENNFLSFASRLRDYGVLEDHGLLSDPFFIKAYSRSDKLLIALSGKKNNEVTKIEAAILVASKDSSISRNEAVRRGLLKKSNVEDSVIRVENALVKVHAKSPYLTDREAKDEFMSYSSIARSSYPFIPEWNEDGKMEILGNIFYSELTLLVDYMKDNSDDATYKRIHKKAIEMARKLDESRVLVGNLTPNFLYVDNLENIWIVDMSDSSIIDYETNTAVVKSKWDMTLFSKGLKTFRKGYNYASTYSDQDDDYSSYGEDSDDVDIDDEDYHEVVDEDELV